MERRVALRVVLGVAHGHRGSVVVGQALEELVHLVRVLRRKLVALVGIVGDVEEPQVLRVCIRVEHDVCTGEERVFGERDRSGLITLGCELECGVIGQWWRRNPV